MSDGWQRWVFLAGRLLLAQLFALGVVQKITDPAAAMALLAERGLPEILIWPAAAFNAVAAVALVIGWRLTPIAFLVAAYCVATSVFHWKPDDPWQMTIVVKNWAIAGGALILAACARPVSR